MLTSIAGKLSRFMALPLRDKALLLQALFLVSAIRIALLIVPFRHVLRGLDALGTPPAHVPQSDPTYLPRVARMVTAVAHRLLRDKPCLTQALAARLLLRRRGISVVLRIGVARNAVDGLQAHAWLEHEGCIIVGGASSVLYTPLPSIENIRF